MGDKEIKDVDVAVGYARELGYRHIVTIGFSMGASAVLRHAGLIGHVDAVVSVSAPGRWYYRGTRPMRLVHLAIEHRLGRMFTKAILKTRIAGGGKWNPVPLPPDDAAALIAPIPLLIVHGDKDAAAVSAMKVVRSLGLIVTLLFFARFGLALGRQVLARPHPDSP